jgi:hypothetical protein
MDHPSQSGLQVVEIDERCETGDLLLALACTPADVYLGRGYAILSERRKTKEKTMKQRRLINQKRAA